MCAPPQKIKTVTSQNRIFVLYRRPLPAEQFAREGGTDASPSEEPRSVVIGACVRVRACVLLLPDQSAQLSATHTP
jgi:hypothetical protein